MAGLNHCDQIPLELDPPSIQHLKAKSVDRSCVDGVQDTLALHTWNVLRRLADQYRLRPHLAQQIGDERLWHRMFWGCFLHDLGKAARGFQDRLSKDTCDSDDARAWKEGGHRHEVLSLAFIDWLFTVGHEDRIAVIGIISSHHRDLRGDFGNSILSKYQSDGSDERVAFLISQIAPNDVENLWQWLVGYSENWMKELGFGNIVEPLALANRKAFGEAAIHRALSDINRHLHRRKNRPVPPDEAMRNMVYRGLILTSDHAASAGTSVFPDMQLSREIAVRPIGKHTLRYHQAAAEQLAEGNALMIAPTGSGKTEAAMLWAAAQHKHRAVSRLFYTLPYQASMNAMEHRLIHKFYNTNRNENQQVTIQHSRATLKFYRDAMNADSGTNPRIAAQQARERKNITGLNYYPVQVFSPYQMLKAAYQLKGYEPLLVDYANALFIFDEIHAYEPGRLALIIATMEWLHRNLGARFLIMTATLPPMVRDALRNALDIADDQIITADSKTFEQSRRHIVGIHESDLLDDLDAVVNGYKSGQSVLVVCNQVARAQQAYQHLQNHIPQDDLRLLHGRFNGLDRSEKEAWLLDRVGVGVNKRKPTVFIATQVVEVSLDVDFDTLYSDPAPIEALLQRFGRVNRGRATQQLCDVHVYTEPADEDGVKPYDYRLIAKTMAVLQPDVIDEAQVNDILNAIYGEPDLLAEWHGKYNATYDRIRKTLAAMKPYQSASVDLQRQFYKLFDGQQILPFDCMDDFEAARESGGFLAASEYLVNISDMRLWILKNKGLAEHNDDYDVAVVHVPYSPEFGLQFEERDTDV